LRSEAALLLQHLCQEQCLKHGRAQALLPVSINE
jgi:hypothetical protein